MLGAINGGCNHDMGVHTYSIQSHRPISEILVFISYKKIYTNAMKVLKSTVMNLICIVFFQNVTQSL